MGKFCAVAATTPHPTPSPRAMGEGRVTAAIAEHPACLSLSAIAMGAGSAASKVSGRTRD